MVIIYQIKYLYIPFIIPYKVYHARLKLSIPVILIGNRISKKFYTKKQPQTD